jgi:hypothetical protein
MYESSGYFLVFQIVLVHVDYLIAKVMELGIKDLGFEIRDWGL